jgi:hypothetical protein
MLGHCESIMMCLFHSLTGRSMADGKWSNRYPELFNVDPISAMESLLRQKGDRALTAKWAVWLAHRDPERGFQVRLVGWSLVCC